MTGVNLASRRNRFTCELGWLALVITIPALNRPQAAEMVELNPIADTFIAEAFPAKNFGAMAFFNSGTTQTYLTNRGLMKFNLSSAIPAGSKILSASLTTEVTGQPDEPWNSALFGLHRLLRDWGEGDNTGSRPQNAADASPNEANFTHRFAFTPETWGQPGGQSGVDYVPAPSTTTWVYEAGNPYSFDSTASLVADVQLWLDQPGTNFGWMLIVQNETDNFTARRFGSRESAFDAPRLSVTYQAPPPFTKISTGNGLVLLEYASPTNYALQVQFTTNLINGNWQSYPPIGPFTSATQVVFGESMSGGQRFYRLKVY